MNPDPNAIDWNADVTTTPEQEYRVLLKSLRRAQGFKLLFVQCAPAEGERLIAQVRKDLPQKQIDVLPLKAPIDNLYDLVVPYKDQSDILFISGLEHSLYDYEKERLWSEDGIYRFDAEAEKQRYETGVPRVLSHLNLSRERFQRDFPFSFVFLVPPYALKYLIRRAPDFFDWRSGVLEFVADPEVVEQESQRLYLRGDHKDYLTWTPDDRAQSILEIQVWLEEPHQTPERKVELLVKQGNLFAASEEYQSAIVSYDLAVALKPDEHAAWNYRGTALERLGRYEDAITSYDRGVAINPNDYDAWYNRGVTLFNLGHYEDAITSYDRALVINPNDYDAWNNRGRALLKLGLYEEALTSFEQTVAINPDNQYVWNNRGIALFNLKRYEDALASYDQAIAINPNNHDAWNDGGRVLGNLGRYEEALTNFERTVALIPDDHNAWSDQGRTLFNLKRYKAAITSYDRAVAINLTDHEAWSGKGGALGRLGRYEDAITSFDRAVAINPDNYNAWYKRGVALEKLGRYEEAITSYDRAVAINPDYHQAWYYRGAVLTKLRRYKEGRKSFERAINLNPEYANFRFIWSNLIRSLLNSLRKVWLKCQALFVQSTRNQS